MAHDQDQKPKATSSLLKGLRLERAQSSGRFVNGRFHNTQPAYPNFKGNPLPLMGEYIFGDNGRFPKSPLPLENPLSMWLNKPNSKLRLTWLGHSTVLMEMDGLRVLTDPVFGNRASPVSFAGPKRFHPPPVSVEQLPPIDLVLVSHDHYDHLCYETVMKLAKKDIPIVTSLGVGARLEAWGIPASRITELDWWEESVIGGGRLSVTATPAQHFSGRGLHDRNVTSWAGWVFKTADHKVFFSGDTGLTEEYLEIGRRLGPFDVIMLEIGAFHQLWGDIHLGPENALKATVMLGGGLLLPVHWSTFSLALHAWQEPAESLVQLAPQHGIQLVTPRIGQVLEPTLDLPQSKWWRVA